jgi:hypothetical protein
MAERTGCPIFRRLRLRAPQIVDAVIGSSFLEPDFRIAAFSAILANRERRIAHVDSQTLLPKSRYPCAGLGHVDRRS